MQLEKVTAPSVSKSPTPLRRLRRGVQQTPWGKRAYLRVKGFPLQTKLFKPPHDTDEEIDAWRELRRAKLILIKQSRTSDIPPKEHGTFPHDAHIYLAAVTAMPTYKERVKHIQEWVAIFGDRYTDSITATEIRTQRDKWLTVGPKIIQRKGKCIVKHAPLSASSVNHRLRALQNFYTVRFPGLPNPVRQVPEADEPETLPREVDAKILDRIFAKLPEGKTKARLEVLRETGMAHSTLIRLQRGDVDLRRGIVTLPGRQKGAGTQRKALPLLPKAVAAFKHFIRVNAWGHFSTSGMHSIFQKAREAARVTLPVTPYQLRHTFGTRFLKATKDLRATQYALDHSTPRLTERYARAAVDPAIAAAFRKVGRAL